MSVKAVNLALDAQNKYSVNNKKQNKNTPSFQGFGNPVTTLMDAIDRGGFAASFIAQDGIGMVAPRIWEGLNRNRKREKDPVTGEETGKKTGPLNWEFARREGIREILSGPSAFLIPAFMLMGIKKFSGTANNVHIDHINALGKSFANFAESKVTTDTADVLKNPAKAKEEFYERVFKNVLGTSLDNKLNGEELDKTAKEFTQKYLEVEKAPSKGMWKVFIGKPVDGSAEDLQGALTERYMNLRKQLLSSNINEMDAAITVEGTNKKVATNFSKVLSSLSDYSNDAIKNTKKHIETNGIENLQKYLKEFNNRRVGSRILSIASMFFAVVGFYTIIPKLYNLGLKHDPGLAGLEDEPTNPQPTNPTATSHTQNVQSKIDNTKSEKIEDKAQLPEGTAENKNKKGENVAFTGAMQTASKKIGEFASGSDIAKKAINKFEFNGASMSVPAMLTLLFGFCLPPRYKNAKSDKERKEILVRDISSFSAILFGANALSRLTSDLFGKTFGLVLNVKPEDHSKSIFHTVKNYLTPGKGIDVLKGAQIDSKYSNLEGYKDRIVGFIDFLEGNDGNAKKVFNMDKDLRTAAETILGKPLKNVGIDEFRSAMKAADEELLQGKDGEAVKAMKLIYSKFGEQIDSKQCNIKGYKGRVVGFIDFLEDKGRDIKKVFNMDKDLRAAAEAILGKPLKDVGIDEIKHAIKAADDEVLKGADSSMAKAMKTIYAKLGTKNKFINMAKTCNSAFGFLSTLVLVPAFMIGVARYCENMTKKRVAEEKAAREAEAAKNRPMAHLKNMLTSVMPSQKPTMTGFLSK